MPFQGSFGQSRTSCFSSSFTFCKKFCRMFGICLTKPVQVIQITKSQAMAANGSFKQKGTRTWFFNFVDLITPYLVKVFAGRLKIIHFFQFGQLVQFLIIAWIYFELDIVRRIILYDVLNFHHAANNAQSSSWKKVPFNGSIEWFMLSTPLLFRCLRK